MAHGARVMLIANLWVDVGLVNGAMGTVVAICYRTGQAPPNPPIAVTVHFDSYTGPTLSDGTVPITPMRRTWFASGGQCSRLQLPLKLAWAVTIHGRTSHATPAAPHQPHRTTRSACACASIAFELTLAPTMLCIHLVINRIVDMWKCFFVSMISDLSLHR